MARRIIVVGGGGQILCQELVALSPRMHLRIIFTALAAATRGRRLVFCHRGHHTAPRAATKEDLSPAAHKACHRTFRARTGAEGDDRDFHRLRLLLFLLRPIVVVVSVVRPPPAGVFGLPAGLRCLCFKHDAVPQGGRR